ncbi:MAG TPA: hypothetical protein VM241_05035 [Candidatus Thermoplasmatota archaeon]|nr:hypothetical protein [Candidatus Thermoplasmatota archaeon]
MRAVLLASLLGLLLAAGCLSATQSPTTSGIAVPAGVPSVSPTRLPDPGLDFSKVVPGDHLTPTGQQIVGGHSIRSLHGGSKLLELAGYNDLTDKLPVGAFGTGWSAGGIWKTYACIAQFAGTGSLAIVDFANPAAPKVLSQVGDAMVNGDCQFTADGRYLFAGAYIGVPEPVQPPEGSNPAGSQHTDGINVWDVQDKANPKFLLHSATGTYHTLMLHTTAQNETFLVQAYSGHIYRFNPEVPALGLVNTTTPMDHDMWVARHPITGKTLLYSGAANGFAIYDFDDPTQPKELAIWKPDPNVKGQQGWHRQASVDQLIDGKAIVVVAGENCGGGGTLPYSVVDVTDAANPVTLSTWEVPGKPESHDRAHLCEMSPHEFSVFDGYVASGNYHAGVWLWDIGSAERLRHPVTLGYYIPAKEPAVQGNAGLGAQDLTSPWNPFVWGAFFDARGYVLVGDFSSGLYVLKVPGVTHEA